MKKRSMMRVVSLAVCMVLLLSISGTALAGTVSTCPYPVYTDYYLTTCQLNIRSGPDSGYAVIGYVAANQVVRRIGTSGSWTQIMVSNTSYSAYVQSSYLQLYTAADAPYRVVYPNCYYYQQPCYNNNYYWGQGFYTGVTAPGTVFYVEPYWNNCYYRPCY